MSELRFIAELIKSLPLSPAVLVGPGDDTAVYSQQSTAPGLITTDMLMEGVHFDRQSASPEAIGYKALAVNLSDIAAMAGIPRFAVVSLAIPRHLSHDYMQRLMAGMSALAQRFDVAIVGGDTNSWDGGLVVSVTLIGEATAAGPRLRSSAQVGDVILVTGSLGGSLGGHHLSFTPRVKEALALTAKVPVHAMLDLSDGLATDLRRLCTASGVGARLDAAQIPINPALRGEANALERALTDGEDFELLLTVPAEAAKTLLATVDWLDCPLTAIGVITQGDAILWQNPDGSTSPLRWEAYEHKFGSEGTN